MYFHKLQISLNFDHYSWEVKVKVGGCGTHDIGILGMIVIFLEVEIVSLVIWGVYRKISRKKGIFMVTL